MVVNDGTKFSKHEDITDALTYQKLNCVLFCRWLYASCWSGIEHPKVLFEKAQYWLIAHKVIHPGRITLERFISKLRARVDKRI
ncbi:DUF4158 domain-containing protein [Vibrio sonorensis]|uniref:DUF4158 domain-containing protein n=1 Tax=Vibrio sonorensis TaxID=1004316 RepID=UPI0008D9CCFB